MIGRSACAISAAVNAGEDPLPIMTAALDRAAADRCNAVIRLHGDQALAAAARVGERVRAGERLPLAGVPMVVKDNICQKGRETTCCSRILAGFRPPYDATVIERLNAAGAVVVATTNMDEFAMGSSTETGCHGPARNPQDGGRSTGGSSGGSAAAVAAGIVPLALGSDTGGSIRQPAAFCGCVGIKPTYGLVSRYGLIAYGSSLDQIGPLAGTVADAAVCLEAIAGFDPADGTSADRPLASLVAAADPLCARARMAGLRIGYIPEHRDGIQPAVAEALGRAAEALRRAGAELVEVRLPHERYAIPCYYVLATAEASSNLSRFDGIHYGHRSTNASNLEEVYCLSRGEGFGPEVKRRIMLGTFVLSAGYVDAYYRQAQRVRRLIMDDFAACFAACDCLLGPVSPTTAFRLGEKIADPVQMYLSDVFTISANLAGIPALSLPFGSDQQGLPVAVHLQARQFDEPTLIAVAACLEAATT